MAINPLALDVQNPDIVGRAFQGFEQGQQVKARNALAQYGMAASNGDKGAMSALFQGNPEAAFSVQADNRVQARAEDAKRLKGLEGLAMMGREIMRLPPEARGPAVEQAKITAARMFGMDPATLDYVTPDTIDAVTATVESEYDRLAQALGLQSAQLGVQGQILGNQGKALDIENQRGVNAYWQSRLGGGGNAFTAPDGKPVAAPAEYQPMIDAAAARAGLPPALLAAQMNQESRFNPAAVSPAGAGGLMQIMPDTAAQPGYGVQPISDAERFEPGKSVEFGANYMGQLLQEFGGNVEHALAAYNWGPGNAKKWVAAGADPAKLPAETRNYVQTIMADFQATGAGSGVGVAPGAAPPPAPGAVVTQGTSFNGQRYAPAGPVAGVSPPAGPVAGPTPSAAPAAPQSVVEIAQSDPLVQRYIREAQEAQFAGDTAGANRANAMVEARMKELQAAAAPKTGATGGKPLTEGQSKDVYFLNRARDASVELDRLDSALASLSEKTAGGLPVIGNYLKSDEYQMAEQKGREFIASILRKETGAAVTEFEWNFYGPTYLPQPGDGEDVIRAKRSARQTAIRGIEAGLGPAVNAVPEYGAPGGQPSAPAAGGIPLPAELQSEPDGTVVQDDAGKSYVIRSGMLVPQ